MGKDLKFETIQLHGGQEPDSDTGSRAVPIYQTTSYVFKDTDYAANLFALKEEGNIYTRISNPTTEVLEKRVASLEGGVGALAVASGSAAVTYTILNLACVGDEIIAAKNLYGGTYSLLKNTLKDYGITTRFVEVNDFEAIELNINPKTKAVYIETIGNPNAEVSDIEKISSICKKHGVPLVVDNTFATPYLCRPIEFGANVIIHSATKFLGGHGTSIGGIIVDCGNFDWSNGRFPNFTTEDTGYNGLKYADLGERAFILRARVKLLRDTGACISPFNSFLLLQGIETLSLRVERHVENTKKIIKFLENHEKVAWINYPECEDSIYKELSKKYLPKGAGSVFTFGIKGGVEDGKKIINNLKIFSHLANVADAKSLIIHPASTTHGQLTEEQQLASGLKPETIRISIGLENIEDLINDLDEALSLIN